MTTQLDFRRGILDELEAWPSVTCTFEDGAKHKKVVLHYAGKSRFVMFPSSPSGSGQSLTGKLGDVRRALKELGAQRQPRQRQRAARGKPASRVLRPPGIGEPAPVIDHWSKLGPLLRSMRSE